MKILINISVISKNHRGMGAFTKQIIKELVKNKNNEYIFVSGNNLDRETYELIMLSKYKYIQIDMSLPFFEQIIIPYLIFKLHPDLCWFPSNTFPIIKPTTTKYIATIHDLIFFNNETKIQSIYQKIGKFYRKYNIAFGVKKLDRVTSVSKTSLREISKSFNLNDYHEKYVLYNNFQILQGIKNTSCENILKKYTLEKEKYFYSITGTAPHKNLEFLIQSFLAFFQINQNYKLVISGASNSKYKGKNDNIIFTEYISDIEKMELIKNAQLFIFPSTVEGFGIPLIEGLYYNSNVLVSDIEIFREIGKEYVTYFNPYDQYFLVKYFKNENKLDINHNEAQKYIKNNFNIAITTKKLENIFNEFR